MNPARVKALELALVAVQFGVPVKDAAELLSVADLLYSYIEQPSDGPREGFDAGSQAIPSRY